MSLKENSVKKALKEGRVCVGTMVSSYRSPQIAQILDLSEKGVYDRIVDWAAQFGFTLDVDVVEFGAGRKDDFIASLDAAFKDWGKKVDIKTGKV